MTSEKALSVSTINPNLVKIEYAVRGPIVARAEEIEKELQSGKDHSFKEVIRCNIGDSHAMGQSPITFFRQTASLATNKALFLDPSIPDDAKSRSKRLLNCCSGDSIGSYSHSLGIYPVRQDVAAYIEQRDGLPAVPENIFLSSGATEAIKYLLYMVSTGLSGDDRAGVMVPIPMYPLYSALNSEFNAYQINYYLDESDNWSLSTDELERALSAASPNCRPRILIVINPGNPTGQVLSRPCMEQVIRFAIRHRLVLLADEVYQMNVYQPEETPWISFKNILHQLGPGYSDRLELASVMSCSKGYMGECGFRGGYCELVNFDKDVQGQLYKALSARLCPPTLGQMMVEGFVNPPREGEPSYELYVRERDETLGRLKLKAELMTSSLSKLSGISCNRIQGSMYAFPRLHLPAKAIETAQSRGMTPDFFYCLQLLETTGICVVPGSGFGQEPGTYHFRITILPPVDTMKTVLVKLAEFHENFLRTYSDDC